jgi:WD40 repeat protein/tRNA A-37 threonylcarbamoyl transferase component Bud32
MGAKNKTPKRAIKGAKIMATEHFKEAGEVFQNAIEIEDPVKRKQYIEKVCKQDPELREEVEALLKAHEKAGDYLEAPAIATNVTIDGLAQFDGPGTKIGRYELLSLIGEGGMGLVYLAEQKEPVKRRVALKIIKPGMDSAQVIARFEAERQALALLDHPNIAHVFDAGTTEAGRPYFVMEYVKGLSITAYCDQCTLNIEQRLRLFEQVCEAIHHAHQKGIIHRDIKPSNILVSVHGDRAVPKIIDFGIAKAITQPLTEKTFVTFQGQLLGTPEYMSPEQVDLAIQDIDIRSDIYSLGVVLYELLAGVLPFERESFAHLGFAEVQRTIREQEPASPSIRLTNLGEQAKTIAASRSTQLIALARRLHRELEWIPLKAMRKDRCRRYRSASEMADDIRNYLTGLPLIAGPETAVYRVKKFVHKHAGSVATVALVAAAIVIGLVISTAMYFKAEKAHQKEIVAHAEAEDARNVAENSQKQEAIARARAEHAEQAAKDKSEELRRDLYVNTIQLADVKIKEEKIQHTHELLESCPNDLRGWEWNYLNKIVRSKGTLHHVSVGSLHSGSICANGRVALLGKDCRDIVIWDVASTSVVSVLKGHKAQIRSVAFNANGTEMVSASDDGIVKLWETSTGCCITTIRTYDESRKLYEHRPIIRSVALSPDGKRIISTCSLGAVMWDTLSGEQINTLINSHRTEQVTYSADGERILGVSFNYLTVWNADGTELLKIPINAVDTAVWSPTRMLIAYSTVESIGVYEATTGKKLNEFPTKFNVSCIALSPDNRFIAAADWNGMLKVWEVASSEEVLAIRAHDDGIGEIAFNRSGDHIVSVDVVGTVGTWRFPENDASRPKTINSSVRLITAAFSSVKRQLAAISMDKLEILDITDGLKSRTFDVNSNFFPGLPCPASLNEKYVVTGGKPMNSIGKKEGIIEAWECETGKQVLKLASDEISSIALSPDGKYVVSGHDGKLGVWDMSKGIKIRSLNIDADSRWVRAIAFDPESKHIAVGSDRDSFPYTITMWDVAAAKEKWEADSNYPIAVVAFSPDEKCVVSGDRVGGMVKIWDANTGKNTARYYHGGEITGVDFGPDGRRIISGGSNGIIKIWDIPTGTELLALDAEAEVKGLSFSCDGKLILAACADGTIKIWDSDGLAKPDDSNYVRKAQSKP